MVRTRGAVSADHDAKRAELLDRLLGRLTRHGETRPSLRALAEAAGVSVPTLRHYFGSREGAVEAVLEKVEKDGAVHLERAAEAGPDLRTSVRLFLEDAAFGLTRTPLGDAMAAGLAEGLLMPAGPAYVDHLLEPTLKALAKRLSAHQERGQMREANPRHAALILFAPLFLACQHQRQLGGQRNYPLDLTAFVEELTESFVRAYEAA